MSEIQEQEIRLIDILRVVNKYRLIIVLATFLVAVVAVIYSFFLPKVYESSVLIEPAKIQKKPVENAEVITTIFKNPYSPSIRKVTKMMGLNKTDSLSLIDRFEVKDKSDFIYLTAYGDTPVNAQELAELISSSIVEREKSLIQLATAQLELERNQLQQQIASAEKEDEELNKKILLKEKTDVLAQAYVYQALMEAHNHTLLRHNALLEQLSEKEMDINYYTSAPKVIIEPSIPLAKLKPLRKKFILLFVMIGGSLSVLSAFIIEYFKKNPL